MISIEKIGLGGGCHWCTEAVFQSLKGVLKVEQGWIKSNLKNDAFSEGVLVSFDNQKIKLETLLEIHLMTHSSRSEHSKRDKYRSAIYYFNKDQEFKALELIKKTDQDQNSIITKVIPFEAFELNSKEFLNYYKTRPEVPFCRIYISPKLKKIKNNYKEFFKS